MSAPQNNTATGVIIKAPNDLVFGPSAIGPLAPEQVIVKVHSAPINPADLMLLAGLYPAGRTNPCTAGLEGSGTVVEAGSAPESQALVGKKVTFFASTPSFGTWADFALTNAQTCFPLIDGIDFEQGACALVNPLTVEAMMLECEEKGHTCVVHAAASSQLGRMMIKIAPKHNVKVINLCRRQENVDLLKGLGAEIVIDMAADGWEKVLDEAVAAHKPSGFFDPICGEVGTKILNALPDGAITYNYGALGGLTYDVSCMAMIFKRKTVRGFWLNTELSNPKRAGAMVGAMMQNLATGVYKTDVAKRFAPSEFQEAIEYYKANMSAGKVLLQNPNF